MIKAIKRPIAQRFMLAMMATTFSALLFASLAMLGYDIRAFQNFWINDLKSQSDIVARISIPALEFNDPKAAQENIEQLKARPTIIAAAIYSADGKLFAKYASERNDKFLFPAKPLAEDLDVNVDNITLYKRIEKNGEILGTIYLQTRYPLIARIKNYALILSLVLGLSLLFASLVSSWLQAKVTGPIRTLTEAINDVINKRDFSTRVQITTEDETGVLVQAFNAMLSEVGDRTQALENSNVALHAAMQERLKAEEALRQLNNTLEERIAARTEELERAHEQLRQSQKLEAVGQLTGGVAHDFNNVLQVISGNLQLLQMSLGGDKEAQTRLQHAAFAADRGAKLASQLLSFARRQPLQPLATNLSRVLRTMDELLRRALGEGIQIETVVAGGLWNTLVDPYQLENVILNLAINARDAMEGEGKLTLELGNALLDDHYVVNEPGLTPGQYVVLAVSDTGCGMPPEVASRAFEPFFTTKREGEGTGLGLSMVYGFVKQSGGHIGIYSEVGHGTTIKIYLPRSHQQEVTPQDNRTGPVAGGSETILVVEDDPIVQATAVDMLSGLGYRVLKAADGQSALTVLQSGIDIDLLFTDVVMPGPLRSPDLARQAKLLFPNMEVLFTSGYTQNAIVHGGRLDPGVEMISKPYRREDLARKIRHMLANRQQAMKPVVASSVAARVNSAAEAAPSLSILVVEDNDDARIVLCDLLVVLGHQPRGEGHPSRALQAFEEEQFDVLLTDISLPDMSGLDLARRLMQANPNLKVIFTSGHGVVTREQFEYPSASLPKPYDLSHLQEVLMAVSCTER